MRRAHLTFGSLNYEVLYLYQCFLKIQDYMYKYRIFKLCLSLHEASCEALNIYRESGSLNALYRNTSARMRRVLIVLASVATPQAILRFSFVNRV